MLILNSEEVIRALPMHAAIPVVHAAFAQLSTGQANIPLRTALHPAGLNGVTLVMPGYLGGSDALTVKVASVYPTNQTLGLPTIHALVLLLDPATGQVLAAMEGSSLTALRTGAASGVATDLLARQTARTAAIIGAGVQARWQLLAVCAVRPLEHVCVYAPNPDKVAAFIAEMQPLVAGVKLSAAATPTQAMQAAEIICTATTSATPVFDGAALQLGTHINGVGSFMPQMQEVDCVTLQRAARIVVDAREGALAEAGDLLIALAQGAIELSDIYGELGELAAGLKPGRAHADEITYFKSVGNAAQDAAVAQAVYKQALLAGLGYPINI